MARASGPLLGVNGALVAMLLLAGASHAEPQRVVVLDAQRPGFLQALQIGLTGVAEIISGPALPAGGPEVALGHAGRVLRESRAQLVVWIETAQAGEPDHVDLVLYAVGNKPDLALIKLARIHARDEPEVDRALALKVGEFLDSLLALTSSDANLMVALAPPASAVKLGLMLEAGVLGSAGKSPPGVGPMVAIGARVGRPGWIAEVYAVGRLLADQEVRAAVGYILLSENELGVGARALYAGERLRIGGFFEAGARLIHARGATWDGQTGAARREIPALFAGADFRVRLAAQLECRVAAGLQLALREQRFGLGDDAPVVDLGGVRALGTVSLLMAAPW